LVRVLQGSQGYGFGPRWLRSGRNDGLECPSSIQENPLAWFLPIHPEGYPFVGGFALVAVFSCGCGRPVGWLAVVVTLWCAYFFRDPQRVTPRREALVSPADGTVSRSRNRAARNWRSASGLDTHLHLCECVQRQ
jgi:phosphatidylserine decarboxylase